MEDIKDHRRVNDILLGPIERPALQWLVARQPAWMNPDILTVIGASGALITFFGYWLTNYNPSFLWLASLGFFINWYGDSLDGTLARYRKIQRPRYGYFIDHTVDALTQVTIFLGLGLSPYLRFDVACLTLIGYLLLSIMVYVRTAVAGVFRISYARIGPTEMRMIAVLTNTFVFFFGNPLVRLPFGELSVYDLVGASLAIGLLLVFLISMIVVARELDREDRPEATAARVRKGSKARRRRSKAGGGSLAKGKPDQRPVMPE
jgi:phosphatidylglycerophosphate synthase